MSYEQQQKQEILMCSKDIRIKFLENVLNEHKISFSPSVHDKSFDDIMANVCSMYNKYMKNSRMYCIENTITEYEIDDEEEEEEEIKIIINEEENNLKDREELVQRNKEKFDDIFKSLLAIRTPKKLLIEYAKLKLETLRVMNINSYIELLLEHCKIIFEICEAKKYNKKRINEIMSLSYSPLDLRLLFYQMNRNKFDKNLPSNVGESEMNVDYISDLKQSLYISRYRGNNKEKIISNFLNYSTAVITLKQSIELYLSKNQFMIYLGNNSSSCSDEENDPYRFYHLNKETKSKKFWEMDCRLDAFVGMFIENLSSYLVQLFRTIYHDFFHDNIYRKDFLKSAIIFYNDCDQLLQNLCLLCNYGQMSLLLRNVIKSNCSYVETQNDVFALRSDDKLLKKELEKREKDIDYDTLEMLFDNITFEQVTELYADYFRKI